MVPCTLWQLRKSRRVLVAGGISWFIGVAFMAAALHWFDRQPYTIPVPLFPIRVDWRALILLGDHGVRTVGQLALLDVYKRQVSGRVSSLALDPADAGGNTLYVGTTGGGVWKTTNAASVSYTHLECSHPPHLSR